MNPAASKIAKRMASLQAAIDKWCYMMDWPQRHAVIALLRKELEHERKLLKLAMQNGNDETEQRADELTPSEPCDSHHPTAQT